MSQTQTRRRGPKAETPPPDTEPETPEAEPDTEPPAEPEQPAEEDPAKVQAGKIDNARRKYRHDLEGIIGDLDGASECPYCDAFGFVPDEAAFLRRDDVAACTTCKGLGQMFTGSQVREHSLLPCPTCAGTGYRPKPAATIHELPQPAVQEPLPAQQVHGYWDAGTNSFHPYGESAGTA